MPPLTPLQALPAVEYSSDVSRWQLRLMAPDIALLCLVAVHVFLTVLDTIESIRMQGKTKGIKRSGRRSSVAALSSNGRALSRTASYALNRESDAGGGEGGWEDGDGEAVDPRRANSVTWGGVSSEPASPAALPHRARSLQNLVSFRTAAIEAVGTVSSLPPPRGLGLGLGRNLIRPSRTIKEDASYRPADLSYRPPVDVIYRPSAIGESTVGDEDSTGERESSSSSREEEVEEEYGVRAQLSVRPALPGSSQEPSVNRSRQSTPPSARRLSSPQLWLPPARQHSVSSLTGESRRASLGFTFPPSASPRSTPSQQAGGGSVEEAWARPRSLDSPPVGSTSGSRLATPVSARDRSLTSAPQLMLSDLLSDHQQGGESQLSAVPRRLTLEGSLGRLRHSKSSIASSSAPTSPLAGQSPRMRSPSMVSFTTLRVTPPPTLADNSMASIPLPGLPVLAGRDSPLRVSTRRISLASPGGVGETLRRIRPAVSFMSPRASSLDLPVRSPSMVSFAMASPRVAPSPRPSFIGNDSGDDNSVQLFQIGNYDDGGDDDGSDADSSEHDQDELAAEMYAVQARERSMLRQRLQGASADEAEALRRGAEAPDK